MFYRIARTAKRLRNTAQGCCASRLPWEGVANDSNPNGVVAVSRLSRFVSLTLGICLSVAQKDCHNPVGVAADFLIGSQGSREAQQPWAVFRNRFAVGAIC
jgi:hypothetical protein